jgi:hypothetical protein
VPLKIDYSGRRRRRRSLDKRVILIEAHFLLRPNKLDFKEAAAAATFKGGHWLSREIAQDWALDMRERGTAASRF